MTREEAIEFIAQSVKSDVDMALVAEAIKALEQQPCEDCISRESVMLRVREFIGNPTYTEKMLVDDLNNLPSVTSKVGKWISQKGGGCYCSECKQYALNNVERLYVQISVKSKYCPNCGCKMQEVNNCE